MDGGDSSSLELGLRGYAYTDPDGSQLQLNQNEHSQFTQGGGYAFAAERSTSNESRGSARSSSLRASPSTSSFLNYYDGAAGAVGHAISSAIGEVKPRLLYEQKRLQVCFPPLAIIGAAATLLVFGLALAWPYSAFAHILRQRDALSHHVSLIIGIVLCCVGTLLPIVGLWVCMCVATPSRKQRQREAVVADAMLEEILLSGNALSQHYDVLQPAYVAPTLIAAPEAAAGLQTPSRPPRLGDTSAAAAAVATAARTRPPLVFHPHPPPPPPPPPPATVVILAGAGAPRIVSRQLAEAISKQGLQSMITDSVQGDVASSSSYSAAGGGGGGRGQPIVSGCKAICVDLPGHGSLVSIGFSLARCERLLLAVVNRELEKSGVAASKLRNAAAAAAGGQNNIGGGVRGQASSFGSGTAYEGIASSAFDGLPLDSPTNDAYGSSGPVAGGFSFSSSAAAASQDGVSGGDGSGELASALASSSARAPMQSVVIVAYGASACVATHFAARHPELVAGLVFLGGGPQRHTQRTWAACFSTTKAFGYNHAAGERWPWGPSFIPLRRDHRSSGTTTMGADGSDAGGDESGGRLIRQQQRQQQQRGANVNGRAGAGAPKDVTSLDSLASAAASLQPFAALNLSDSRPAAQRRSACGPGSIYRLRWAAALINMSVKSRVQANAHATDELKSELLAHDWHVGVLPEYLASIHNSGPALLSALRSMACPVLILAPGFATGKLRASLPNPSVEVREAKGVKHDLLPTLSADKIAALASAVCDWIPRAMTSHALRLALASLHASTPPAAADEGASSAGATTASVAAAGNSGLSPSLQSNNAISGLGGVDPSAGTGRRKAGSSSDGGRFGSSSSSSGNDIRRSSSGRGRGGGSGSGAGTTSGGGSFLGSVYSATTSTGGLTAPAAAAIARDIERRRNFSKRGLSVGSYSGTVASSSSAGGAGGGGIGAFTGTTRGSAYSMSNSSVGGGGGGGGAYSLGTITGGFSMSLPHYVGNAAPPAAGASSSSPAAALAPYSVSGAASPVVSNSSGSSISSPPQLLPGEGASPAAAPAAAAAVAATQDGSASGAVLGSASTSANSSRRRLLAPVAELPDGVPAVVDSAASADIAVHPASASGGSEVAGLPPRASSASSVVATASRSPSRGRGGGSRNTRGSSLSGAGSTAGRRPSRPNNGTFLFPTNGGGGSSFEESLFADNNEASEGSPAATPTPPPQPQ